MPAELIGSSSNSRNVCHVAALNLGDDLSQAFGTQTA
jgi:hypothetical protein